MAKKLGVNTGELGSAVRRRREQQNLSLRDVADLTGVSASTLSRIENGTGKPDADNLAKVISDALIGIVYVDDAAVCDVRVVKRYADAPLIHVEVQELE